MPPGDQAAKAAGSGLTSFDADCGAGAPGSPAARPEPRRRPKYTCYLRRKELAIFEADDASNRLDSFSSDSPPFRPEEGYRDRLGASQRTWKVDLNAHRASVRMAPIRTKESFGATSGSCCHRDRRGPGPRHQDGQQWRQPQLGGRRRRLSHGVCDDGGGCAVYGGGCAVYGGGGRAGYVSVGFAIPDRSRGRNYAGRVGDQADIVPGTSLQTA